MMDKGTIDMAVAAIRKHQKGEHFSSLELLAALDVLKIVSLFAEGLRLSPLNYWAAQQLSMFEGYSRARKLVVEK